MIEKDKGWEESETSCDHHGSKKGTEWEAGFSAPGMHSRCLLPRVEKDQLIAKASSSKFLRLRSCTGAQSQVW